MWTSDTPRLSDSEGPTKRYFGRFWLTRAHEALLKHCDSDPRPRLRPLPLADVRVGFLGANDGSVYSRCSPLMFSFVFVTKCTAAERQNEARLMDSNNSKSSSSSSKSEGQPETPTIRFRV